MKINQMTADHNRAGIDGIVGEKAPRLSFFHANPKGTGCAVTFALHVANGNDGWTIELTMANQKTVPDMRGNPVVCASFDYNTAVTVVLDLTDVCQFLQVFRGECESVNEGRGIYEKEGDIYTVTRLSHIIDPTSGYMIEIRTGKCKYGVPVEKEVRYHILITPAEALGLCEVLTGSLSLLAFGYPRRIA